LSEQDNGSARAAWSNWQPLGRIQPKTSCKQARELFINFLQITTGSLIFFTLKDKQILIHILSAALHTSAMHAVDYKTVL
jgi:hypothetical protein